MRPIKLLFKEFQKSTKKKKGAVLLVLLLFIFACGFLGFLVASNFASPNKVFSPLGNLISGDPREPRNFPNPINGVLYTQSEAKEWKDKLPLAVVIENHTDARPQSGLSRADLVYEALAEGGITRFLAVYLSEDTKLGPIRSNRPYFIDWLMEYDAGYAHVGGSPKAQSLVKSLRIADLDQFFIGPPTYERSSSRFAPHNVYTTTAKLRRAASGRGYKGPVNIDSWQFADDEATPSARPRKSEIGIPYPAFGMNVLWRYDAKSNTYLRFNAGVAHKDAETKKQLFAKTVIVQYVKTLPEESGHGRLKMGTVGSGKVLVFKDGKTIVGKWKKTSRKARTGFFDQEGNEISLNRGKIWVQVVPSDFKITIKK